MRVRRLATSLLLAAVAAVPAAAHAAPPTFAHSFVVRKGMRLYVAGKPFRFGGANIEWLGLSGYGPADPGGPRYASRYEIEDALATAQELGANVVRSQTMGDSVGCGRCIEPTRGAFNARAFAEIDYALASARAHGIKIIPTIVGDDARAGGSGCVYLRWRAIDVPNCSLINMEPFWSDPRVLADVEQHIRAVLDHVNVYTHVAYKNDPTILGWDLLNGGGSPTAWTRKVVPFVRSIDRRHLILSGAANAALPGVGACVAFVYPHWQQSLAFRARELAACRAARKPFLAYEYGWDRTNYATRADFARLLTSLQRNAQIAGDAFWALQAHRDGHGWMPIPADTADPDTALHGESGEWWALYYPGIPTLVNTAADMRARAQLIRAHNFRMRGLPVPPHMAPPAPRITNATTARIYWRGAAGAATYSVQRAARRGRPWTTPCRRCVTDRSDGYDPAGRSGWYRVIAYNLDGRPSRPSAAVQAKVG
ncbi:MAG: hypothetical protein JF623_04305 [Acidobacteria bacterium]|jgi:mannan endo-1,4-beta-mannosidase|nr:hypothetical protein [Acidobacteriota bacterium]